MDKSPMLYIDTNRIPIRIPFHRSSPTFRLEVSIDSDEVLYPKGIQMECPLSAGIVLSSVRGPNGMNQIIEPTDQNPGLLVNVFSNHVLPVNWGAFGGHQNDLPSPMVMIFHGLPLSSEENSVNGNLDIDLFVDRCGEFVDRKVSKPDNPPKCKVRLEFGYDVAAIRV